MTDLIYAAENSPSGRACILCVDDEPANLSLLEAMLSPRGYDVVTASNGQDALEKIQAGGIDLCLLDVMMPAMDGFEVCKRIKGDEAHRNVPVVLVTAYTDRENRIRGIQAGAEDFISKPLDTGEVLARVKMLLHVQSLHDRFNKAREFAENIVETVREPLLVLDAALTILTANHSFYEMFKESPETTIGKFIYDIGNRQWDIPSLRILFDDILSRNSVFNDYEVEHDFTGIGSKVFMLNARQLFGNNSGTSIILLAMEDVSERKLAEKMREDIERITQHDLKTPLSPIISIPDILLMDSNITPEQTEWIMLIRSCGYRMLDIIDASLSLYKMEQGTYLLAPVSFNLLSLLSDIARESADGFAQKQIKLVRHVGGIPAGLEADFMLNGEVMLCYTMMSNLIKNALEASPPEGAITVSCRHDRFWNYIDIHNMGSVPEAIRSRFFEKYVTLGKKTGTGLGTYSALLAARTMQGDISMSSSVEDGTLITVRLPKNQECSSPPFFIHH